MNCGQKEFLKRNPETSITRGFMISAIEVFFWTQ